MQAILELPELRARIPRWTVQQYENLVEQGAFPDPVELIRGFTLQKISKSPLHRTLTKRIYDHFLAQKPGGHVVFQEAPMRLADSEPEPDAVIVQGEEGDYANSHPTTARLVVEVAVSSAALDRANASLYAEAGVLEYWIVLGREKQVEVYRHSVNGVYRQSRLYSLGEPLVCESVPGLVAPLEEWFA